MSKKLLTIAILLVFLFLFTAYSPQLTKYLLSSSRQENSTYSLDLDDQRKVDDISLGQAVAYSINQPNKLGEVYQALSRDSVEDLTLDEYRQYINALKELSGNVTVTGLSRLSQTEKQSLTNKIVALQPELADRARQSEYYHLLTGPADREQGDESLAILAVQHREDGQAYLDPEWIRQSNDIYQYGKIYFKAIQDQDRPTLKWLFQFNEVQIDDKDLEPVLATKLDRLINYYNESVLTSPLKSRCSLLLPGLAEFDQELYGSKRTDLKIRRCIFRKNLDRYVIEDPVQEQILAEHTVLSFKSDEVCSLADQAASHDYTSSEAYAADLGKVKAIKLLSKQEDQTEDAPLFEVTYQDLTLVIQGREIIHEAEEGQPVQLGWEGKIMQIDLDKPSAFSFGDDLRVGMSLAEVYASYPFIRESSYVVSGIFNNEKIELSFHLVDGKVGRLSLKRDL